LAQRILDVKSGKTVWHSQKYSGVDEWISINLLDARPYELQELWFNGNRWRLVITDYVARTERRTIIYDSRELLMEMRKYKRLRWEETISLPENAVPPTA
jgi:hypothetical protein